MRRFLALFTAGAALAAGTGAPAWAQADEPPIWHDAERPETAAFPDPQPIRWRALTIDIGCLTPGALLRWPDDLGADGTEP